ncbi:MAG: hypothetical protein U0166_14310 [Acidobacteriota bacterium]
MVGDGSDVTTDATIHPVTYVDGMPHHIVPFNPFPGTTYGVTLAGANLGL